MMIVFILVLVAAFIVLGKLFYTLKKEADKIENALVVPVWSPVVEKVEPSASSDESARLKDALELVSQLREENRCLRMEGENLKAGKTSEDDLTAHLKAENAAFRAQLEVGQAALLRKDEEVVLVKKEWEERLARANKMIAHVEVVNAELKTQGESLDIRPFQEKIEALTSEVEALKKGNVLPAFFSKPGSEKTEDPSYLNAEALEALREDIVILQQDKAGLESRIEELESSLYTEKEKTEALRYELTKSRAQSAGMERICSNASRKFEEISRDVRLTEQDNDELRKQASFLERSLNDFHKINTEFVKKDRLAPFDMDGRGSRG